ncbi:MAG TPA: EAL domain-containing protein [Burkholderiales bacterium]|nr:EAL domain-containing protein [Burkholderiales bacterium]
MAEKEQAGEISRFLQEMDGELVGWNQPAARLRKALDQDHLCLYAQPIVSLREQDPTARSVAMVEVLVRLREEEARMLPPGEFLPAFEHFRMMAELDRWVLRSALRRLALGGPVRMISVNASSQTVEEPGFAAYAASQLREAGVDPAALVIEIDESDTIDRRAAAERFAGEVKAVGCRVTLDGFARRSVSFEALKALRVDYVKVDGAVTRRLMRSDAAAAKLKAIQRVGEITGIGVVAECVEEEAVIGALRLLKVGYAQGFGVGTPEPIENLFKS